VKRAVLLGVLLAACSVDPLPNDGPPGTDITNDDGGTTGASGSAGTSGTAGASGGSAGAGGASAGGAGASGSGGTAGSAGADAGSTDASCSTDAMPDVAPCDASVD
jgi:hypothetical protein